MYVANHIIEICFNPINKFRTLDALFLLISTLKADSHVTTQQETIFTVTLNGPVHIQR
jgi:hypothetical protein